MNEEELSPEQEKDVTTMLRAVYNRDSADWLRKRKDGDDVFSHKIKAAADACLSIKTFLDKVCYSLWVQSVVLPVDVVTRLEEHASKILRHLRKETVYYVLLVKEANIKK